MRVFEITVFKVRCPNPKCGRWVETKKRKGVLCRGCRKRFDL